MKYGAFLPLAKPTDQDRFGKLDIIRTSVDRPEIAIAIVPIERGMQSSYAQLLPIVDAGWDNPNTTEGIVPTPGAIKKTIIFVDGRGKISHLVGLLRGRLEAHGYSVTQSREVVGMYTGHVSKVDQDKLYQAFKNDDARVRIMVATTALGMDMDLSNVERIYQWGWLLTRDLGDLVQRFGRGARQPGQKAVATFFAPYYAFDSLAGNVSNRVSPLAKDSTSSNRMRVFQRKDRFAIRRTHMSQSISVENLSQNDTGAEAVSGTDDSDDSSPDGIWDDTDQEDQSNVENTFAENSSRNGVRKRPARRNCFNAVQRARATGQAPLNVTLWSKTELEQRTNIDKDDAANRNRWLAFINSKCHRQFLLDHFQEYLCRGHSATQASARGVLYWVQPLSRPASVPPID